jgi:DNA (cytosine-5)-methyltransferase 1
VSVRPPVLRIHADELIVDNFAGGGGASLGIEMALGRSPDIAVNHDPRAVAMHKANHPNTRHLIGDVWDVDPVAVCEGRRVGLAWFSPDCTHHSKAKGGKPRRKRDAQKSRALAWVVVRWAKKVKPRVIMLENVEEFADWGPLLEDGRPDKARKSLTFRRWQKQLENCGYVVERKELRACDFGAPTTRKRLFIIARSDGQRIVWPEPTHGKHRPLPYRAAAECIDWSHACPSIFDRPRPLADKTLRRIARGLFRYVIDTGTPFIVPITHTGERRVHPVSEPLPTITCASRGEFALVAPSLIQTGYGEREGQAPRSLDIQAPLGTIVGSCKHALVAAFLAKHNGGHEATGSQLGLPIATITTQDHHSLVTSHLVHLRGTCKDGQPVTRPAPTITASGTHLGEVRAFLTKYYGQGTGQSLLLPLGTVTTKERFGLVMVAGEPYAIADIGMRMLQPRELFRAQGFPDSYVIDPIVDGKPLTKTAQIKCCGNSVSPVMARALALANLAEPMEIAA